VAVVVAVGAGGDGPVGVCIRPGAAEDDGRVGGAALVLEQVDGADGLGPDRRSGGENRFSYRLGMMILLGE
jgi:hypothetical protein